MGIYEILNGQSQTIKLSLIHQNGITTNQKEHIKELQEFMKLVQQEAEAKEKTFASNVEETTAKSVQALKGNLSEFLSTPLRSDQDEILKHIVDHAKQLEKQYVIPSKICIYDAVLSKYSIDDSSENKLKPLFVSSRRLLKSRGFSKISDRQAIFASDFIVDGIDTLSVLESILSGLLSLRMKTLFADATVSLRAYDLFPSADYHSKPADKYEILLTIRNREMDHSAVLNNLHSWLESIGAGNFTWFFWKKRLLSGYGGETILEIRLKDKLEVRRFLLRISDNLGLFKQMFSLKESSLFIKERIVQ